MTESGAVRVEGADTLARTLSEAARELAVLAPESVGALIASRSQAAAPFVSGRLRSSIHADTTPGKVTVGSDLEYAHVIHNGWSAHNIAANPFLFDPATDLESVWGAAYEAEATRIIKAEVRGA